MLTHFGILPALEENARLKRTVGFKTQVLKDMKRLKAEHETLMKQADEQKRRYASRPKGFTLFAFLDQLARETGIKDHIAYMKPSSSVQKNGPKISVVEMKLQAITLEQLINYLYGMEISDNMVTLKRASFLKKGKDETALDAILQVETIMA
jgi:general secretion pathway protein M